MILYKSLICLALCSSVLASWSSEELAMYDLIEDLGSNFYDFFSIKKDATLGEIKKAYRRLSLEYHPDRNHAEDATVTFRNVVAVYEILKSTELREKYDNVLEFGLPDWRQPIYYYRKMRKFSWWEALLVLLLVATIAHYCMMWASYYEKKLVLSQTIKKSKKKKASESEEENKKMFDQAMLEHLPNVYNLLPFLLVHLAINLTKAVFEEIQNRMKKEEVVEEETVVVKKRPAAAPKVEFHFEVAKDVKAVTMNDPKLEEKYKKEAEMTALKSAGEGWSFEELSSLIRLSSEKFPPGTPSRWDLIGRALNRNAEDVTAMAGKLKNMKQEDYSKLLQGQQSESVVPVVSANSPSTGDWSQEDQKLFEIALKQFPKGTDERWERISEAVPGKDKEQCLARFKQLAEIIKKRKQQSQN
ncbi:unnamed protein product [Auanema sp. JU1783]|nr:unnamed protein product [Auanema sp. JU1783]